jgi:hypothetical protein
MGAPDATPDAERPNRMSEKVACEACGAMILPSTAEANGGVCMPCKRGDRGNIETAKLRYAERKKAQADPEKPEDDDSKISHSAPGGTVWR